MTAAVVFAYSDVGARCLEVLLEQHVDVRLLVTHEDDPGEHQWFASVAALARRHAIDTITPEDANTAPVIARVRAARPDFLFSFYYRRMLGAELLGIPPRGAFNMHGSLLPRYRGRAPVNWAILKGESETGATLHEMVAKPDAGRIVDQQAVPIGEDDLAVQVAARVTEAAGKVLARSLPGLIAGTARLTAQDLSHGSYFGGRKPEDGRIDWTRPAREIHNLVRAVAPPFPGAFSDIGGKRVRLLQTRLEAQRAPRSGGPGLYREGEAWFADCADGKVLRLVETDADSQLAGSLPEGGKLPLQ
jgi:methionyl-tRNA formyltransferase